MALSPLPQIVSGPNVTRPAVPGQRIAILVIATITTGVGPTELEFPDPSIRRVFPRLGTFSPKWALGAAMAFGPVEDVVLTQQAFVVVPSELSLDSIALVPAEGCQMDAISAYIS